MHATNRSDSTHVEELTEALAAPFDPREVRFKPAAVSGKRALALAYVDARVIQDRLDDVLGVTGWQDEYECLPDGSVVCRLRLRIGDEWITKMDVGGQSEQPDEGDRRKAAFSDALKRAAVKFGIGRYLYRLPSQWVDYDPQKKQFARTPTLPPSALPKPKKVPMPVRLNTESAQPTTAKNGTVKSASKNGPTMPANGAELQRRVHDYEARLAQQGVCQPGDLVKHIVQAGVKAGHEADLATWSGPAIALAVEEARAFESRLRQQKKEHKEVA
ncbi:MAG TPA: Rad52/Rad22 family DNA repair protein [Gemmataceae bacterium]|nr:Rad52/Rad22 family DNA repair protein [Gemmataceae bacterium]